MISQDLEVSLHMAFVEARQKRHEFITVEHLVLALLDNPSAKKVFEGCGTDAKALRAELERHISRSTPSVREGREVDTQPTLGFQRVLQRAILHVQSAGKKEVTGADVLVAVFGDKDAHAIGLLKRHGITRLDVVNYVSHGVTKPPKQSSNLDDAAPPMAAAAAGGPALASELQARLDAALQDARTKHHEFVTVEHLLLVLADHEPSADVLRACGADLDRLRADLVKHIAQHTPLVAEHSNAAPARTLGFERVIRRATQDVQSLGKREINAIDVLVAIFGETDSHAVFFLQKEGVTRLALVSHLANGGATSEAPSEATDVQIVLYRDDHTPMEFLVRILLQFFAMDRLEAAETLLEIYRDGKAVCGLYSRDAGETTVKQVLAFAHEHGHALRCSAVVPNNS